MIIDGIDISTKEGCEEFNKKYTDFKAYIREDGSIVLEGLSKQEHLIYYDHEDEMFKTERKSQDIDIVSESLPSKYCDESCYYHCTKGGQQPPECVNER